MYRKVVWLPSQVKTILCNIKVKWPNLLFQYWWKKTKQTLLSLSFKIKKAFQTFLWISKNIGFFYYIHLRISRVVFISFQIHMRVRNFPCFKHWPGYIIMYCLDWPFMKWMSIFWGVCMSGKSGKGKDCCRSLTWPWWLSYHLQATNGLSLSEEYC